MIDLIKKENPIIIQPINGFVVNALFRTLIGEKSVKNVMN